MSLLLRVIRISSVFLTALSIFFIGVLYGSSLQKVNKDNYVVIQSPSAKHLSSNKFSETIKPPASTKKKMNLSDSLSAFSFAYNTTHLWSMRLADDEYYRIANLLPCRPVEYVAGTLGEKMDSCNEATKEEFSVESTIEVQRWFYEHQHPADCSNKKFAIIHQFAWSGFGSTLHQIVWPLGIAFSEDRIAVYQTPGNWLYGNCPFGTPDCFFLPISNCSVPSTVDGDRVRRIKADDGHWKNPVFPVKYRHRSFNWFRSQLLFYIMRYNSQTLAHVQQAVAQYFKPPTVDANRPYIAVYVRRSDKVINREMSQAYPLEEYFQLFDGDARRANISTVYINSEDEKVFKEYERLSTDKQTYYRLLTVKARRDVVFMVLLSMGAEERKKIVLEFLTDLYIEAHADLHSGTLSSNWCRLVDEIRFALGKSITYYTPENRFLSDM